MMGLNAAQGDNASLVCTSFSSPITIEVVWYHNGVPDPSLRPINVRNEGLSTFTSTLSFQPLQREHEGNYFCFAYNMIRSSYNFTSSVEVSVSVYCKYRYTYIYMCVCVCYHAQSLQKAINTSQPRGNMICHVC